MAAKAHYVMKVQHVLVDLKEKTREVGPEEETREVGPEEETREGPLNPGEGT